MLRTLLHVHRDACGRLNGKELHGRCLRVELASTSTSQRIPRGKVERDIAAPPRKVDRRLPPKDTNGVRQIAIPQPYIPPVSYDISDSGPSMHDGESPHCNKRCLNGHITVGLVTSIVVLQACIERDCKTVLDTSEL
jgi:hypothetical protein